MIKPVQQQPGKAGKLYLKIPSEQGSAFRRTSAVLNMFPGHVPVVLYFADTKLRRQTMSSPDPDMLQELREILGHDAVVLK